MALVRKSQGFGVYGGCDSLTILGTRIHFSSVGDRPVFSVIGDLPILTSPRLFQRVCQGIASVNPNRYLGYLKDRLTRLPAMTNHQDPTITPKAWTAACRLHPPTHHKRHSSVSPMTSATPRPSAAASRDDYTKGTAIRAATCFSQRLNQPLVLSNKLEKEGNETGVGGEVQKHLRKQPEWSPDMNSDSDG